MFGIEEFHFQKEPRDQATAVCETDSLICLNYHLASQKLTS